MSKNVKERLLYFIAAQGLSKNAFEVKCGLSKRYVSNISVSISPTTIKKISLQFPLLNTGWLLTGEGEMLKGQSENTIATGDVSGNGNHIASPKEEEIEVVEAEEVEIKETPILTADVLNQEGLNLQRALSNGTLDVEVKPTQDVLPPHNAKAYTETDDMSPEIEANDPVFVELLSSPKNFEDGRMYLVNLHHGSFVRWVVRVDDDHVKLFSMKSERMVPISSIKSMAEVVAITKRPKTLPKHRITIDDVIAHKDAQLAEVNAQINSTLDQNSRLIGLLEKQLNK